MKINQDMMNALRSTSWRHEWLVHVKAKQFVTNAVEELSLWTGGGNLPLTVDGFNRTYIGAGNLIDIPGFTYEVGLGIQTQRMSLAILSPEIINMIRAYDSRQAPIQIHLAIFDDQTNELLGTSVAFDGFIDEISIQESETDAVCEIGIVPSLRQGTKTLTLMKSDATQRLRDPSDEGFKYTTVSGEIKVIWGHGEGWKAPGFKDAKRANLKEFSKSPF